MSDNAIKRDKAEQTKNENITFLPDIDYQRQILITNKDKRLLQIPEGALVFDRSELKKSLKNKNHFFKFLTSVASLRENSRP